MTTIPRKVGGATIALLAAAAVLYGVALFRSPPLVGLYHDDGIYVGSALSLVRDGSYRIPHLPGSPYQAKYPPLTSALLAPVAWWTAGDPARVGAFRWPSVIATLCALALLPGLLRRWGLSPRAALGATALTGVSPLVFQHGLLALSEAPYLLVILATFRLLPGRGGSASRGRWIAAAVCATAAVLCRSAGVVLLPALALAAWPHRRRARAWIPLAAAVAATTTWTAVAAAMQRVEAARELGPLYDYYLGYRGWLPPTLAVHARVVLANFAELVAAAGDAWLGLRVLDVAHWRAPGAVLGAIALGGWWRLGRSAPTEAAYLGAALLLIVVFPFEVPRFVVPLTPFLAAGLCAGGAGLLRLLRAPPALAPLALAIGAALAVDLAAFPGPDRLPLLNRRVDPAPFEAGAEWLRRHTAPDDIVVSDHDPWVYLASGRRALPPGVLDPFWDYGHPEEGIDGARVWTEGYGEARRLGARWVLVTRHWHPLFRELWLGQLRAHPNRFPLRFESDHVAIYELRATP